MTGVRNGVLGRGVTDTSLSFLVGTVPDGYTWLLKAVHVWNTTGAQVDYQIQMNSADNTIAARLQDAVLEPNTAATWSGWTALDPGDHLWVYAGAGVFVWAAGAELPGSVNVQRHSWAQRY